MNEDVRTFFEYQNKGEDIYDALQLDSGEKRAKFRRFLERNNLEDCLNLSDKAAYPNSWVGAICYGRRQVMILPKLLNKHTAGTEEGAAANLPGDSGDGQQILRNLIFMLSYTHKLDIRLSRDAALSQSPNPFLEILIREFAVALFEALKRQTPKAYVGQEANLRYLKGKLQIGANIRYNIGNKAQFFCAYDEFTEDNALNQAFLAVATALYQISQNSRNRQILTHIKNYYSEVQLVPVPKLQHRKIMLNRSQQIFAKAWHLAQMFLEHASVDLSNYKINSIALLWDMNVLFEEFIYEVMGRHSQEQYSVAAQVGRRLLQEQRTSTKRRNTYVDILVTVDSEKIVLDTKYKKFTGLADAVNGDVYQVFTYCLLHGANKAILVYPQWEGKEVSTLCTLNKDAGVKLDYKIKFLTVDLRGNDLQENVGKLGARLSGAIKNYGW